jgi:type II secretory pathway component GspD/PulD (secretin)
LWSFDHTPITHEGHAFATETIEFIDTGTILEITPYVNGDQEVLLNVKPEINSAQIDEAGIPVVSSTVVSTWLLAKSGETVFIGGLIQDARTKQKEGVPYISDVPGLGHLFGRTKEGTKKNELVILITPQIVQSDRDRINRENKERIERREKRDLTQDEREANSPLGAVERAPAAVMDAGPEDTTQGDGGAKAKKQKGKAEVVSGLPAYLVKD